MPNEYKSESLTCYENVSNLDIEYSKYFKSFVPIFIRLHTILQLESFAILKRLNGNVSSELY